MINVLEKITELRLQKRWTEYQLAEASGLTQSTISSWYRKNMLPTLPSLMKVCDAFNISVSQFFMEDNSHTVLLSDKQIQLINAVSKLNSEQYDALLTFIQSL
ncbi:MAG: helix-turn-helix domain-containing protein [Roseburia sp.]|nr:helix-turn-helix domain-containing protein [Roseburia sp.]